MNREQAIETIKDERGEITGKALEALVADTFDTNVVGARFLRTDKLVGDSWRLQNLTTPTLRAMVRWLDGKRIRLS